MDESTTSSRSKPGMYIHLSMEGGFFFQDHGQMPNAVGPSEINSGKHHRFDHVLVQYIQVHACMTTGLLDLVPSNNKSTDGAILSAQQWLMGASIRFGGGRLKPVSSSLSESPRVLRKDPARWGQGGRSANSSKCSEQLVFHFQNKGKVQYLKPPSLTT